jgi:hypothetical protein
MEDITYSLAEAASKFHAAETEVENLGARLAVAQADRGRWLPIYFRGIMDAIADGRSERDIAREVTEACGRSRPSVLRDIARAMIATATGWSPDATIGETPNINANGGPSAAKCKAAIAEVSGKREARDVVRALFAPEPAPETETEPEPEDTGSGNVTGSARGPVLPYDALVRALTAYAETEDMDAQVFAHNVNNAMMDIITAKWATAPANA